MEKLNEKLLSAAEKGNDDLILECIRGGASVNCKDSQGWTPLHKAAYYGQDKSVEILKTAGGDVHARDNEGFTPLHLAAQEGQDRSVQILMEGGADVHARDNEGFTPLHLAAQEGQDRSVQILMEGGADVHARDNEGWTPLHLAAGKGHDRSVQILMEGGADVHARTNEGDTPLHYAAQEGQDRSVQILMEGGADVHARTDGGWTPLHLAAEKGQDRSVQILMEGGADVHARNNEGHTPLHVAAQEGQDRSVQILMEGGADVHARTDKGWTPLHLAAEKGQDRSVQILMEGGADVHARNNEGHTPLHLAAGKGQDRSVQILMEGGADVHARTDKGRTPLHLAAYKGQDRSVQILMEGGADVHARTDGGWTPLHLAAEKGQDRSVQILMEGGADVHARNNEGHTPLHVAAQEGQDRSVQILMEGGADVHARTDKGWTPLHLAAEKGQDRSVQILMEGGADVHARNNEGHTPLHLAAGKGQDRSVQILMEGGADVHARTDKGRTPLHLAAYKGQDRSVQILMEGGADVHARTDKGVTPLHWAAQKGQDRSVQILMEGGADVHARTDKGFTPLHLAAWKGHDRSVQILMEGGADVHARNNTGDTALLLAAYHKKDSTARILTEAGSDINAKDNEGKSALHYASKQIKTSIKDTASQIKEFESRFLNIADTTEFTVLISKGTYKSYHNRVYFAGACNVGKSTLASNFIGENILTEWKSTDGLIIFFGRNGIDLKMKKMVPLTKGHLENILSSVLRGRPSVEQSEGEPLEKQSSQLAKRKGVLKKLKMLFKTSKKPVVTAATLTESSIVLSKESTSSATKSGDIMKEQPIKKELIVPSPPTGYQLPSQMSKQDPSDVHRQMVEELQRGKYKIQIAPSDLVDFGGQRSFDMTHQLFIQQKGAFVLLLDGRKDFDENLSEYASMTTRNIILHWVNSILTYCSIDDDDIYPLIVFAATHRDAFTKKKQHKKLTDITTQLRKMFSEHELHERIKFDQVFFINATDRKDPGVESLKEYLVSVAFQQKSWGEKMPIAWVPLELQMAEMRSNNICILPIEELNSINMSNGDLSLSDDELKHFLRCQHSFGQILYFNVHRLDRFIIVQPTAMVDILRSFITDEIFWPSKPSLRTILSTASKHGIIERSDLYQLWEQDEFNKYVPTPEIKEFTAQVLVHLDILVEPKHHETEETLTDTFLVPCMINQQFPFLQFPYNLDKDKTIFLSYKLSKSTLPNALVYKLIGAALSKWPLKKDGEKLCLYDKAAILSIDQDNDLYLIYSEDRFMVGLSNANSKTNISQDVASVIQECLTFTLKKVLTFYFTCFGQSASSLDVSDCFTTEVVVQCGEDKCFIPLSVIKGQSQWTCQHQTKHSTDFDLYWMYDQRQEEPRGLNKEEFNIQKILDNEPEDKHLLRLAKEMGEQNFYELIMHLELDKNKWDNIKRNYPPYDNGLTQRFICLFEWKKMKYSKDGSPTYKDLYEALNASNQSEDVLSEILREPFIKDYDMTNPRLSEVPGDDVLDQLSEKIGYHAFELGLELDLETSSIEQTVYRYSEDIFKQTYDILTKWKKRTAQPTVCSLMHVLKYVDSRGFRFLLKEYSESK